MAKNRLQFLTYVKYDFKRDDKDTEIIQAYNDTLRHLTNLRPFEGLKFMSYILTIVRQPDYPLPSNKCHIIHPVRCIKSISSTRGYAMNKRSREEFMEMYPNLKATGTEIHIAQPTDYNIYSNQLWVGPLPDLATYLLEMDWAKKSTEQAASADIQELGEEWEEIIKWGTLARLFEGLGLSTEADRFWGLYRDDEFGYPLLVRKDEDQTEKMEAVENNDL